MGLKVKKLNDKIKISSLVVLERKQVYEACLAGAHCFVCFRMFQMSFHLEWEGGSVLCYRDGRWSTRTVKSVTFANLNYKALCSLICM